MGRESSSSLLQDLEAIRQSLDKIADTKPNIPTLEEIVGHRAPTAVNPSNPFLSSRSLTELLQIRNEAESQAAEELAALAPVKSVEDILAVESANGPTAPAPEEILKQMEVMFDSWIENSVTQYMQLFESELRNRLQQDFRDLVAHWYKEHDLPIPEGFLKRVEETENNENETNNS